MECLIDETADVETASDWKATLPDLTGVWADDVVSIAKSQLGYTESTANFQLDDNGKTRKGYTRYGAWYGNEYGDWDAMFASFCLYYAGVDEDDFPEASGAYAWTVELDKLGLYDEDAEPTAGDLVFFDADEDGKVDHVGIVIAVKDNQLTVIEGDSNDAVEKNTYNLSVSTITGYGVLPEQEEVQDETETEAETNVTVDEETATLTYEGEDYTVTVSYGADAELPESVELVVSEYDTDSDAYQERYTEMAEIYDWEEDATDAVRLFNIGLYVDGEEVEPAGQVKVSITFLEQTEEADEDEYAVVHFGENSTEQVVTVSEYENGEKTVSFELDGFSDVATINLTATNDQGTLGGALDGDYAYLTDVNMVEDSLTESGYSMRTGTASWDSNDSAGNDSSDTNNVLRTYDIATYTVTFTSRTRSDAPYKTYETGTLYFEFILEGDSSEVQFETGSMGWLTAKKDAQYIITEEEIDGVTCQVLRGSYTWEPSDSSDHAIGESTQELTLAIRALALKNGDTIQPKFTFFLYGNDVGVNYTDWGTSSYSGGVVTSSGATCSKHSGTEYQTITAPEITVSAVASYNIVITASSESTTGTFDFSTGTTSALNQSAGSVTGRLASYGITIQIVGKSATEGLKGVELPKSGEDITFTLTLSSSAQYSDTKQDTTDDFTPLVWSLEGNSSGTSQADGRTLPSELNRKYAPYAPFNKNTSGAYNSCYDGGTWSGSQSGNTVTITISDWQLKMDLDVLPYAYSAGSTLSTTYYDSSSVSNYWEVQYACISAGELWVVQPFYTTDGKYILDYLNTDDMSFTTTVKDSNLSMQDEQGKIITEQAITTDDTATQDMALVRPGTIVQSIAYQKYNRSAWNDPVTEGCWENPKDWILTGNQLSIFDWISNESAEGEYTAVAYDELIKFDDAFFEPDGTVTASTLNSSVLSVKPVILYGAKADKSGWSHTDSEGNVLSPGDDGYDTEVINATTDDLVYFNSLTELEAQGYTCVAVLVEWRGLASTSYNHTDVTVKGTAKTTADTDCVYMVTHYGRSWNRSDLATACAESNNVTYASYTVDDVVNMGAEEIKALVDELIPSRASTALDADAGWAADDALSYDKDYPSSCYWINGGSDGTTSQSDLIRNYTKAAYDENGYVSGATSGVYYGDSCLLVGYTTGVTLNVAQTTTGGTEKAAYDMDTNQRTVDYVVQGNITRNSGESTAEGQTLTTNVTMTVTLPDGLTYLEGSAYIGGTYTSNGEGVQGTVTGGTQLIENGTVTYTDEDGNEVSVTLTIGTDADGNRTLTYTLTGVTLTSDLTQYLDKIYFSCTIGNAGQDDDVENNDSLVTSVTIETTEDCNRDFTTANGNYAETGILISKNSAISLVKSADQSVVDVGDDMGFTMTVGNNGNSDLYIAAVDALPYQGDGTSSFTGDVVVSEFSVTSGSTADLNKLTFYYTTYTSYQGVTSEGITGTSGYSESDYFTVSNGWYALTLTETQTLVCENEDSEHTHDSDCYEVSYVATLPSNFKPTAIVAVGTLSAGTALKMHITIQLPGAEAGDYIDNTLTRGNLSSTARCRTVNRTLSGLAWVDVNGDGYQNSAELTIDDVQVALLKLKDNGDASVESDYEAVCYTGTTTPIVISTGQQIDVLRATGATDTTYITNYTDGNYLFKNLSAGTYAVRFTAVTSDGATITGTSTSFVMADYDASPVDAGSDDTKDSDATPTYSSYTLTQTAILGIVMPEASELEYSTYSSPNHDSGFLQYELKVTKVDTEDTSTLLEGATFKLEKLDSSGNVDDSFTAKTGTTNSSGVVTLGDPDSYTGLASGVYLLTETKAADGYNRLENPIKITIQNGVITAVDSTDDNVKYTTTNANGTLLEVVVTNDAGVELPLTGGTGTYPYTMAGLLLTSGAAYLLYKTLRRRKEDLY